MSAQAFDDSGKLILRLGFGVMFLLHGVHKAMGHPQALEWITSALEGRDLPGMLAWGVYAGEILAPILIILGFFARVGAALTTVTMIFAIYLAHSHEIFVLNPQFGGWQIELQGMFLLASLVILLSGPGRFSFNRL